jgi:hypothetical protein
MAASARRTRSARQTTASTGTAVTNRVREAVKRAISRASKALARRSRPGSRTAPALLAQAREHAREAAEQLFRAHSLRPRALQQAAPAGCNRSPQHATAREAAGCRLKRRATGSHATGPVATRAARPTRSVFHPRRIATAAGVRRPRLSGIRAARTGSARLVTAAVARAWTRRAMSTTADRARTTVSGEGAAWATVSRWSSR